MTKTLTILGLLIAASAGMARADEDCFVPMADWQPREAVARLAQENGWTVRRIKIDDGCYAVDATDANGRRVKVKIQPATLAIMGYGANDDEEHRPGHGEGDD